MRRCIKRKRRGMTHASEGTLVAYLDNEVTAAERAEVEGHLAACEACVAEMRVLSGISGQFRGAVSVLDVPAPVARAHREIVANREAVARPGRLDILRLRRAGVASLAKAAGLAVMLAGAASAAIPDSPVRRLVAGAWERVTGLFDRTEQVYEVPGTPAPPVVAVPDEAPVASVSFAPSAGAVRIALREVAAGAQIRVVLVDEELATVRSSGQAEPRFNRGPGRIEASGLGEQITVEIPRSVNSARVELDGRVLLIKAGASVRTLAPPTSASADEYVFPTGT